MLYAIQKYRQKVLARSRRDEVGPRGMGKVEFRLG